MLFKTLFSSLLIAVSGLSQAQIMAPKEAHVEVDKICKQGCVVLSVAELQLLENQIKNIAQGAYNKGVEDAIDAVKDNPSICKRGA